MSNLYVPANLAIEAMRDNGYKNTTYAIAELIDNSIQAGATFVQLICAEKEISLSSRTVRKLYKIAVLDNGIGMNEDVLKKALQFGNGTRLTKAERNGIGRFGMGLPASSISQCKLVEVWSWQNGVNNALYTYLNVDEVKNCIRDSVPEPIVKSIPTEWIKSAVELGETGTLVVWSELDRLLWSRSSTLIDNSEFLIGRLYRKFINEGSVKIKLSSINIENPDQLIIDKFALPNDPGYLMSKTSCPEPFNNEPMFERFGGNNFERRITIEFNNEKHDIILRFSIAKDKARESDLAGSTAYGKHAAKNVGVSIVRAGRELDMDKSVVIQYDPRERWWGIEVEFPPALDELMGVTNNKQTARNFADVILMDIESLITPGKTINQVMAELNDEGDPRAPLIEVAQTIKNQVKIIRELIKEQTRGLRANKRYKEDDKPTQPEIKATELTNKRKEQGYIGGSDSDESKPENVKKQEIEQELVDTGIEKDTAQRLAARTVSNNLKYLFAGTPLEGDAFFTVRPKGGAINIILNTRHPAYEHLVEVLDKETTDSDNKEDLEQRLNAASEGLKLLLMAWARYEDELPDGQRKIDAQNARNDWGRVAKVFLNNY